MSDPKPAEPIMQFFSFAHLPPHLQQVSRPFCELADKVLELPRNPERSVALRKLLEAKDAAVRALIAVAMLCLLAPSIALADTAAQPAAPSFSGFLAQYVLPGVLAILGTVATALLGVSVAWVQAKAKGTAFEGAVTVATEAARSAVAHVDAELKPKLLAAMSPDSDGGVAITAKEAAELKAEATRLFYASIAPDVLKRLQAFFGPGLGTFVSGLLERALDAHQVTQAAGEVAVPPAP